MVVLALVGDRAAHPKMARALELAEDDDAPYGENPRVGCVIADVNGVIVGEGFHRGAGTPHAEVVALEQAGQRARGGSAYVTLEPCNHAGRTGPCTTALIDAGVSRVIYGQSDPNPKAAGGAQVLKDAGIEVLGNVLSDEASAINREWSFAVTNGRPFVTLKMAVSLDGRVANPDGSRRSISGSESRRDVAELRSRVQAILIGARTAVVDDPSLTARYPDGTLMSTQPLRVVVGMRELFSGLTLFNEDAPTLVLATHDPSVVMSELAQRNIRHVLIEGGPTVASSFLNADLVDEVLWYCAPTMIGEGPLALGENSGVAREFNIARVQTIGEDLKITANRK